MVLLSVLRLYLASWAFLAQSRAGASVFASIDVLPLCEGLQLFFFFSSRRRHTRFDCDWSSDVCSSDLRNVRATQGAFVSPHAGERPQQDGYVFILVARIDERLNSHGDLLSIALVRSQIGRASCRERV